MGTSFVHEEGIDFDNACSNEGLGGCFIEDCRGRIVGNTGEVGEHCEAIDCGSGDLES